MRMSTQFLFYGLIMTVWRSVEEARIDPSVFCPPYPIRLINDAHRIHHDPSKSYAFKEGYLYQTIKLLEQELRRQMEEEA